MFWVTTLSIICYIIWKCNEISYDQQKNFEWRLHFHTTLEQNNKKTAKLITSVSDKLT